MLTRRCVRPLTIGVVLISCVTACAARVERDDTTLLRELGTPPPSPPRLILSGVTLPPVDWEWLRQDGWDKGEHDDESLWDVLPTRGVSNDVRFELDAREPPTELIAVIYRYPAQAATPPAAHSGQEHTCTPGGSVCSLDRERSVRGVIHLQPAAGSTEIGPDLVIVLHAQWEVATDSEPALDAATYGFKAVIEE